MRVFSFAQESTRYCNYSKSKFNNECTFIIPNWMKLPEGIYDSMEDSLCVYQVPINYQYYEDEECPSCEYWFDHSPEEFLYIHQLLNAESMYQTLLHGNLYGEPECEDVPSFKPWTAQEARNVLPLALKTELVMTGTTAQWIEFFKLRCARDAHPQAREVAEQLRDLMIVKELIFTDEEGNLQVENRRSKTEAGNTQVTN